MLLISTALNRLLGERTAKALAKQFGITTAGELLEHFPRGYQRRGELTNLASLPLGEQVTVVAEVVSATDRYLKGRSGSILEVVVTDGSGELTLAFFNQAWRKKDLRRGVRGLFSGKIGSFRDRLQLAHPDYELFEAEIEPNLAEAWAQLPIPIYRASASLASWKIQQAIEIVLAATDSVPELFDETFLSKRGLLTLTEAVRRVHQPRVEADWQLARDTLRFHEAMLLQLEIRRRRTELEEREATVRVAGTLLSDFDSTLPFALTAGQVVVGKQIADDLASGRPMHRLLQGEVGSGKTLVALRAMLTVAQSGGQTALLAPTEVLAVQHYESIRTALGDELAKQLGLCLLTGQTAQAVRKRILLDLVSGKSLLVVGTHALISEGVEFADLSLVIIDEQHRFGVSQREALRAKSKQAAHTLVMTATPIPRTLAITVFGDLEISTLRELPVGRSQISTHVVPVAESKLVSRVWQRVAEEISNGRQAFVVCPRIEGEEYETAPETDESQVQSAEGMGQATVPAAAAVEIAESLSKNAQLEGITIGLLHGRLASEEKSRVMAEFAAGKIQLLVATTVIEVGVNVPNASTMVVLDADRFGLSQLHQLRGRVGRGEHPGLCLLLTGSAPETLAGQRLTALAQTSDGFKLSEIDLELRGEGDVLGERQSGGRSSLQLLRVIRDQQLIAECRELVRELPDLTGNLAEAVEQYRQAAISRG